MTKKLFIRIVLFCLYISLLIYLVLFSAEFGRVVVNRDSDLVPFDTIQRYYRYRTQIGEYRFILDIYGNILAFAPLGYFVFMFQKKPKFFYGFFSSFLLSIAIEISQYLLSVGSLDVDDVILNTIGGTVIYLLLYIGLKIGVFRHEK